MQNHLFRIVCLPLILVGVFVSSSSAQNTFEDVLEYLGSSPPDQWNPNELVQYKKLIAWKRQQLESMHARLAEPRDQIKKELEAMSQKVEELQDSLPVELQFSTAETRAQLATHAAQLALNTKLDLAVAQERIVGLEGLEPELNREATRQRQLDMEIARQELEIAANASEAKAKQQATGLVSAEEVFQAAAAEQIARRNLEKAELAVESMHREGQAMRDGKLAELRIEQKPLKAKLEVAETFLKTMRDSASSIRKIEQIERERELMMRDLEWVAGQLGSISRELLELQNLSDLIEQENKKRENQQPAPEEQLK